MSLSAFASSASGKRSAPISGLPPVYVPWVLAVFGLGMTVGNLVGGWAADRDLRRTVLLGFPFFLAAMAAMV